MARLSSSEPLVVQKYGGTSVGTAQRMLEVATIVKASTEGHRIVVVLSAMSSYVKAAGTTSRLLEAAKEVLKHNAERYSEIVETIREDHLKAIREAIEEGTNQEGSILEEVERDVNAECDRLKSFMSAADVINEISPRSRDVIISVGEKLSARIFTAVLQSQGVKAAYINLESIIQQTFDERQIDQTFYDYLAHRMAETIRSQSDETTVPVVTGFFGPVPGSIISTIGRGYTDLSAALIAVGLGAHELQIWKEVDGIFTADPRKAPSAYPLESISPEEAAELTYYGSEVIHPFTMEQVIRATIPIRIKNTFKPDGPGTVIVPENWEPPQHSDAVEILTPKGSRLPRFSFGAHGLLKQNKNEEKKPTAVTIKDSVVVLNVHSNRKSVSHGFFAQIFSILDRHGIVVDLIATSEVHVSMALSPNVKEAKLEKALLELKRCGTVDVIRNMAILSLVGKHMRNMVGIAGHMFATLAKHRVNIEMISQGASEINISCVIEMEKAALALKAVHDECIIEYREPPAVVVANGNGAAIVQPEAEA
ncbi:Aspartokinase [Rhizophlyctis rosea]|uniref:Aspartokinase n=1 Tax=Rhizophlyctis rosea TaxID=64517 RepID=A0AAD5SLM6_9FUNG|nr:Aspartokinase [Rhizophlyctis rosea]